MSLTLRKGEGRGDGRDDAKSHADCVRMGSKGFIRKDHAFCLQEKVMLLCGRLLSLFLSFSCFLFL